MERKPQILVVDDEVYLREIICQDLEDAGYAVLQAASGTAALAMAKKEVVDLVVSDVRMPSGNGLQLLGWLREMDPGRPSFVFMTAYADVSSDQALHLGAEAFLRKPLEKDELLEVVAEALVPRQARWGGPTDLYEGSRRIDTPVAGFLDQIEPDASIVIGQGGMFLPLKEDLPGCFETVQFDLACGALKSGRLCGFGRVRWVRHRSAHGLPPGVGIEFMSLIESSRLDLVDYLAEVRPKAYVPLGTNKGTL